MLEAFLSHPALLESYKLVQLDEGYVEGSCVGIVIDLVPLLFAVFQLLLQPNLVFTCETSVYYGERNRAVH